MVLFVCTSKVWKNKTVKFGYTREVGVEMGERELTSPLLLLICNFHLLHKIVFFYKFVN